MQSLFCSSRNAPVQPRSVMGSTFPSSVMHICHWLHFYISRIWWVFSSKTAISACVFCNMSWLHATWGLQSWRESGGSPSCQSSTPDWRRTAGTTTSGVVWDRPFYTCVHSKNHMEHEEPWIPSSEVTADFILVAKIMWAKGHITWCLVHKYLSEQTYKYHRWLFNLSTAEK